jgi:long-chain acyl-CoA synthetase
MKTIIQLFEESVLKYPENPFLWEKNNGAYQPLSYIGAHRQVEDLAAGLLASGVQKGDRIALLSEGRNDWVISELAILFTGAVNVPLSIKLNTHELRFRLAHSGSHSIIVSGNQLEKVRTIADALPELNNVIVLDEPEQYQQGEKHIAEFRQLGKEALKTDRKPLDAAKKAIDPQDYANISYTSGTTADPKGIILSHRNYTANVEQACTLMDIPPSYRTLAILPLDHCFAHVACVYSFMYNGASVATVQVGKTPMETLRNIPTNIKEIKPHILMSVPALAKNFRKNIESAIRQKGKTADKMFQHALKLAYAYNKEGHNKGGARHALKKPLLKLYDKLLFSKIRENFGGELQFFIGGGALLDIELQRFFYAIGIPMFQGYGLSEATPVISSNSLKKHKLGSSGHLVHPIDIKIVDEEGNKLPNGARGEILVKGENVMVGYWKNESATKETIRDGWLDTGDLGYLDDDGFIYVFGRSKSLLISSDGEKYSPESIEEAMTEMSPYIDQVMLHNNQNPYTTALLVPNKEALKRYVEEKGKSVDAAEGRELALKKIEKEVKHFREGGKYGSLFPNQWIPTTIGILSEPFSEENKFINSTMKMVRPKITEYYAELIDYLFTPEAKNAANTHNLKAIERYFGRN